MKSQDFFKKSATNGIRNSFLVLANSFFEKREEKRKEKKRKRKKKKMRVWRKINPSLFVLLVQLVWVLGVVFAGDDEGFVDHCDDHSAIRFFFLE